MAVTHDAAVTTTNTAMYARHNIVALRDMDSGRPESPTVASPPMKCMRSHGTTLSSSGFTHIDMSGSSHRPGSGTGYGHARRLCRPGTNMGFRRSADRSVSGQTRSRCSAERSLTRLPTVCWCGSHSFGGLPNTNTFLDGGRYHLGTPCGDT